MSRTTCQNGFIFVAVMCLGLMVSSARGGSLDDTGAPTDPASAMYTAKDLYNRLAFGTNALKRTGAFTEPTAGPTAGTMPTTDEIMAQAPATNASGAVASEVVSGKTFWGLTQGAWGTRTGTIATVTLSDTTTNMAAGYYAATNLAQVATNLAAGNIVSNIGIFGVTGTAIRATGDATAADVLAGKTFSQDAANGLIGNVAAGANLTGTAGARVITITDGLYSGSKTATANDAALVMGNIKAGATIFGVLGSNAVVDTTSGTAGAGDVKSGQVAWVQGAAVTGTIATVTLSPANDTVSNGYYVATTLHAVDANLAAGNIATNVTIFGIAGTANTNAGGGTYPALVPKTGQTNSYDEAGDIVTNGSSKDDGYYQVGVAWHNPRFTTNNTLAEAETNVVTDNLTGLMWTRNATNNIGLQDWTNAISSCTNMNKGGGTYGYHDWRLPNMKELQSLIAFQYSLPALSDGTGTNHWTEGPFTGVQSYYYWSSTTYASGPDFAWYVDLSDGNVYYIIKTDACYVWPVRGGQ